MGKEIQPYSRTQITPDSRGHALQKIAGLQVPVVFASAMAIRFDCNEKQHPAQPDRQKFFGGTLLIARSDRAVIVSAGLTPGLAEIMEPSQT